MRVPFFLPSDGNNASSGPPTEPANLGELPLWLDGFKIDGIDTANLGDLAPISEWVNMGFGGNTFKPTQATAPNQPTVDIDGINGHPSVLFDASDFLHCTTGNPNAAESARHYFLVVKVPATRKDVYSPNEAQGYSIQVGASSSILENNQAGVFNQIPAPIPDGTEVIIEMRFDGITTNRPRIWVAGVEQVVVNGAGVGVGPELFTNTYYLGYQFNGGRIGELLVFNAVQSDANAAIDNAYLSNKWGLAA